MNAEATEPSGIGSRVRGARKRRGWSRETLAFYSGISWSAIAQIESGRRTNVRPHTLSSLAGALGVTIDYLVNGAPAGGPMLEHAAFPYSDDVQFQTTMGSYLEEGIERSEAGLAVTTPGNIELLREHLGKDAGRVEFVESDTLLTTPAAAFDEFRTFSAAKIKAGAPWVRLISQPIWSGRSDSEVLLWTRFESLLNVLFGSSPLTLACPYDERSVSPGLVTQAHATHPHILCDSGMSKSSSYGGPGRFAIDS
jgi:transcriptional regulator with XRE-family HTH domain